MWPYKSLSEEEYNKTIDFVYKYAESIGAKYICLKIEKLTTLYESSKLVKETLEMKIYKYKSVYFWMEHHFLPDCPYIVLSFGNSIDSIFEDADLFPYNLDIEEI